MTDLTSTYLGLRLRGPVIASAGPLTGRLDTLLRLEAAGVSAVVLPSLFEEEMVDEELTLPEALERGTHAFAESLDFFPDTDLRGIGPQRHVELLSEAKQRLSIPVIASVNASHPGSWERYAAIMVDAYADAIELNVYALAADRARGAAEIEAAYLEIVREVRASVTVPLVVKLSPFLSALPHFAAALVAEGVDGLVLFNRFYQPDLSLHTRAAAPTLELSTSADLRLPLRWLGILRPQLPGTSLAASSGVHTAEDVLKALLVGADVACMTSALLRHGPEHVAAVLDEITAWLAANDFASIEQLRGSLTAAVAEDPDAFERAGYVQVLSSYQAEPTTE